MLHPESIHYLVQVIPGVTLKARGVGHWPHGDLRGSHLLVDVATIPAVPHVFELNPIAFVKQCGSGRILDQRDIVTGIVLPEDFLAEHDEKDDEHKDDEKNHSNANQLFFAHVRMSSLDVGDNHRPQPTVLAHKSGGAVTQKRAKDIDTRATVFTFLSLTFVDIFLTPEGTKRGVGDGFQCLSQFPNSPVLCRSFTS